MSEAGLRAISGFGLLAMLAIAWAISSDRRSMPWRILPWGLYSSAASPTPAPSPS